MVATSKLVGGKSTPSTGKRKQPGNPGHMESPPPQQAMPDSPQSSSSESDLTDSQFVEVIVDRMSGMDSIQSAKQVLKDGLKERDEARKQARIKKYSGRMGEVRDRLKEITEQNSNLKRAVRHMQSRLDTEINNEADKRRIAALERELQCLRRENECQKKEISTLRMTQQV